MSIETTSAATDADMKELPRGVYLAALALCVAATIATYALYSTYRETDVWGGFKPARAFKYPVASDPVFANSIFRTRANAWSNLAYAYAGFFAIAASIYDLRRRAKGSYLLEAPATGIFFGLSCVYLGIGSGIFHASLTHWGQQLDVASMYSALVALIALNLGRARPHIGAGQRMPTWPFWIAAAIVVDYLLYEYKWSMRSSIVLPGLIWSVLVFTIYDRFQESPRTDVRWLYAAIVALVLAVACRALDVVGPLADPAVWLTGHALWHVFTAACLASMYAYYRSERRVPAPR